MITSFGGACTRARVRGATAIRLVVALDSCLDRTGRLRAWRERPEARRRS